MSENKPREWWIESNKEIDFKPDCIKGFTRVVTFEAYEAAIKERDSLESLNRRREQTIEAAWKERDEARAELDKLKVKFNNVDMLLGEHSRHCDKLDRELTAERAKLQVLREALEDYASQHVAGPGTAVGALASVFGEEE